MAVSAVVRKPSLLSVSDLPGRTAVSHPTQNLLHELLSNSLIIAEDWENLSADEQQELVQILDKELLLQKLVAHRLLTQYQADRILADKTFGLMLDHYRVLERLGSGGMGVVFKAEHVRMRRLVAIKVLPLYMTRDQSFKNLSRFYSEVRALSQLQHPNVVRALDAGEVTSGEPEAPVLHYYVMEYYEGNDLEEHVKATGPMKVSTAVDLIYQVAGALQEAHEHNLVHRDIKPSNILLTREEKAKLLDFGLVRHFRNRMTEPGTVLGTVDYIAPEQARDASAVDIRADIYGLGGTLFWCLTGRPPFDPQANLAQELALRQTLTPPSVRIFNPEVPAELDAIITRMMACNPDDRYPHPQAVMNALLPFLKSGSRELLLGQAAHRSGVTYPSKNGAGFGNVRVHLVMVVDDEAGIRDFCKYSLQSAGLVCDAVEDGSQALAQINAKPYDLVLVDWVMPGLTGPEVVHRLRENPPSPYLKVIMFSGHVAADDMAQMMRAGVDDYLEKPFSIIQLNARVQTALQLKDAQEHADSLNRHLLAINRQLEDNLHSRDGELVHARNALVLALAKLVGYRDAESGGHLLRLQRFVRRLAEEASTLPHFASQIDRNFIQNLECCTPLHDIGKVGLPDHILMKDGKLDMDERIIMQTHTTIGAETLQEVMRQHGQAVSFLEMAIQIARHHHERYDGTGYPDRLSGENIPLAARIVAVADVYDALRTRRQYKPALNHASAMQVMVEAARGHFDPNLMTAFTRCADDFELIFKELPS